MGVTKNSLDASFSADLLPYVGPNHGGRLEETKSTFAAFWVLMVQHDGIKVVSTSHFAE